MGYRLNVAKKYVIEYADIEAFNWKILEFHALLSACGAQYTGEENDLSFEVMKEDWEMMIDKISSLDSLEDEEEKKLRGRPATGVNTVDVHYKMASDLFNALPSTVKRNTYINDAVREKMTKDGYIGK